MWSARTQDNAGGSPDDGVDEHEEADEAEGGQRDGREGGRKAPSGRPSQAVVEEGYWHGRRSVRRG